jgi:amino acid adenylation domain-containing protein
LTFNSNLSSTTIGLPGLAAQPEQYSQTNAKFDLTFGMRELNGPCGEPLGVKGGIEYSVDLFDHATAVSLVDRWHRILESIATDAAQPVSAIDVLAGEERRNLLASWNGEPVDPVTGYAHELFERQAALTPGSIAITAGDETVDYAALNAKANQLARHLIAGGVGPEDRVAIVMPPSVALVVALLAVLKSGGAYVPVSPDYPADRISYMIDDAGCRVVLSEPIDASGQASTNVTDEERLRPLNVANAAYLIYTSGSTGRPKGVLVEHRNLARYLRSRGAAYPGVAGSSLVHSPVSFDLTVTPLYGPLISGGAVRLGDLNGTGPRPTFLKGTPSHLELLLLRPDEASPTDCLVLGGEALTGQMVAEWRERHPESWLVNSYGPTESTVSCADFVVAPGQRVPSGPVPIGQPLPGVRLYVLDRWLQPAPVGVAGDLYVAGAQLARGYFNRPALTAERFVADPFGEPGDRMYRTGDLGRRLTNGLLEFAGRADDQVKVRGHRIELGEIESSLLDDPTVLRAAATVHDFGPGDQRIVGYVVPRPGETADPASVRRRLAASLPDYLVPATVLVLDRLPLTPNDKLDRDALPQPEVTGSSGGRAPRNYREATLCQLFAEVLGATRVGVDDDFFALGGHSLTVVRLADRIEGTLGVKVTIADLFSASTPARLADALDTAGGADALAPMLPLRTGEGNALFCIHPAAGVGWVYSGLLSYLSAAGPVHALQADGLSTGVVTPGSADALVDDYVKRIREQQPTGPYALLGWSVGGLIAHLVAVRLQEDGEDIALLALLDSYPGGRSAGTGTSETGDADALQALAESLGEEVSPEGGLPGLADLDVALLVKVFKEMRSRFSEVAPGMFRGDVLLVTAMAGKPQHSADLAQAWRAHVTGDVEVVPVDCVHGHLTRPAAMSVYGPIVADRLERRSGTTADGTEA